MTAYLQLKQYTYPEMKDEERIHGYIEEREEEIIEYLRSLIAIPTQAVPGENYDKIANYVGEKLSGLGFETAVYDAPDDYMETSGRDILGLEGPRSNLVASLRRGSGLTLHLNAHTDTVPVTPEGWTVDPFAAPSRTAGSTAGEPATTRENSRPWSTPPRQSSNRAWNWTGA